MMSAFVDARRVGKVREFPRRTRTLLAAAVAPPESLEPRLFLHAGHDHAAVEPTALFSPQVTSAQLVSSTLSVTATSPFNGAINVAAAANVTVAFSVAVNPATVNATTFELRNANNVPVPAAVTYNATTRTATLNPTADLTATSGYYHARVKGGTAGVKDAAGNHLASDFTWSFTRGGQPAFTETTVFSGLSRPTQVKFSSDGRVFVAEKSGLVKVFDNLSDTTATVFADLRTQTHNFWDRGLLGLALHPNFPATPYVYVLYTYDGDVGGAAPRHGSPNTDTDPGPDATGAGAIVSGRLSRLTASGNTMVPGSEQVLIHDWQQQYPSHSIGSLQFGPDGALYASGGDGASFNFVDYGQQGNPFGDPQSEGGSLRSQDLLTPGDPTTLDGTIIRIDPDSGAALPGNPLYNSGNDANAQRIIASGQRNPFRFTFRPGTSEIWAGDVGWSTWEEINRIVSPTDAVLENFGWPAYEGNARQSGYDGANLPMLENYYARGASAHNGPYYTYRHSEQVVPGSGEPTGGSSITGLAFYNGTSYPAAYDGALFFSDYSRRRIYVMFKGPNGLPNPASRQVFKSAAGSTELTTGPGGDLF